MEAPRYRKPRGSERVMRVTGLWRLNGNTLPPAIHRRYRRYHEQARAALSGTLPAAEPVLVAPLAQLREEGLCHVPGGGRPRQEMLAITDTFSRYIESENPLVHRHHGGAYALRNPLDVLGESCLEIFDGPTGALLQQHYGSHFRLEWVDCYRTYHDAERLTSWLWHIDNIPNGCLKAMLLVTDSARDTGAMRYLPRKTSLALRGAGYFGCRSRERELDLSAYASRAGVSAEARFVEAPAGDVLVFDPNILHCAEPPKRGFRDVMTFFVRPSLRPWREEFQAAGRQRVHSSPGGYPSAPEQ